MSRLKELIERLCPDGVEYHKLISVANVLYGYPFNSKLFCEDDSFIPLIRIRDVKPAKASTYYSGEYSEEYIIHRGDILVGMDGNFNLEKWNDRNALLNQRVCKICSKDESIASNRFLYHLLGPIFKSIEDELHSGTVIHLSAARINKISIPIPPIEIQTEIAEILDRFADYAASLQAELQARKEQYEYYRNLLLTFNPSACGCGTDGEQEIKVTTCGGGNYKVTWKAMGEIGKFFGGLTGKSKSDFTNGNARFISYMNVYSNIALNQHMDEYVCIGKDEKQNTLEYGDSIFTGSSETPDECGMSSVVTMKPTEPLYLNSFCFGFRLNDKTLFAPDFLKHLLRSKSIRSQIAKTANGVTRFNVSKVLFAKIVLPIPPYELQVKIASILDRFEALVNDLTQGLPAEIAAVRERYEYYRNKLLTFKRIA